MNPGISGTKMILGKDSGNIKICSKFAVEVGKNWARSCKFKRFHQLLDFFKASSNWLQTIHSGGCGKLCYLGGPGRQDIRDLSEIHGSVVCNV